jgi:hypothetical protein
MVTFFRSNNRLILLLQCIFFVITLIIGHGCTQNTPSGNDSIDTTDTIDSADTAIVRDSITIEFGTSQTLVTVDSLRTGIIKISGKGELYDGISLSVPDSAFCFTTVPLSGDNSIRCDTPKFSLSGVTVKVLHNLDGGIPLSPALSMNVTSMSRKIMTARIPVRKHQGLTAGIFNYDDFEKTLSPVPVIADEDSFMSFELTYGSTVLAIGFPDSMLRGTVETGFLPGKDNWEFHNMSTYICPDGICMGMCISEVWHFMDHKRDPAAIDHLYGLSDDPLNPFGTSFKLDNNRGIRYASAIHSEYTRYYKEHQSTGNDGYEWLVRQAGNDGHWVAAREAMCALKTSGVPQPLTLQDVTSKTFHGVLIYAASFNGSTFDFSISDPKYSGTPEQAGRHITIDKTNMHPYESYTKCYYYPMAMLIAHGMTIDENNYFPLYEVYYYKPGAIPVDGLFSDMFPCSPSAAVGCYGGPQSTELGVCIYDLQKKQWNSDNTLSLTTPSIFGLLIKGGKNVINPDQTDDIRYIDFIPIKLWPCISSNNLPDSLNGEWEGIELATKSEGWTVRFTKSKCWFYDQGGSEYYSGTYSILADSIPYTMDISVTTAADTDYIGKTALCIFKLIDGTLTFAGSAPGSSKRPLSFNSPRARTFIFTRK